MHHQKKKSEHVVINLKHSPAAERVVILTLHDHRPDSPHARPLGSQRRICGESVTTRYDLLGIMRHRQVGRQEKRKREGKSRGVDAWRVQERRKYIG